MRSQFTSEGDLSEEEYLRQRLMEAGFPHEEIPRPLEQLLKTIKETKKECRQVN